MSFVRVDLIWLFIESGSTMALREGKASDPAEGVVSLLLQSDAFYRSALHAFHSRQVAIGDILRWLNPPPRHSPFSVVSKVARLRVGFADRLPPHNEQVAQTLKDFGSELLDILPS